MSVIMFVLLIMSMIGVIVIIAKSKKKTDYPLLFSNVFTLALVYFQNRLLYSMCVN